MDMYFDVAVVALLYVMYFRSALYTGILSLILSLSVTNFVYFYTFHSLKSIACKKDYGDNVYADLVFGVVAGKIFLLNIFYYDNK